VNASADEGNEQTIATRHEVIGRDAFMISDAADKYENYAIYEQMNITVWSSSSAFFASNQCGRLDLGVAPE
jgi:hypothetical protein